MKRPGVFLGLFFLSGLLLASLSLPKFFIVGAVLLAGGGLFFLCRNRWQYIIVGTLSCLMACCLYWQADARGERQLAFAGEKVAFTGSITSVTVYESGYAKYILDGKIEESVPAKVSYFTNIIDLPYGEVVTLSGTPEREETDYLYDSESYAKSNGIFLAFDMSAKLVSRSEGKTTLRSVISNWRMRITEEIRSHMGDETGAMLTGMLFGDKSGMSRSSKTAMSRTGISHVLAVSGLHLDFIALLVAALLKRLRAGRKFTFAVMAVVCGLFVICAGETVSVERACIMVLIRHAAPLFYRKPDSANSLCLAMLLLGIANPFVIHSAAFWLSCSGAFGMGVIAPYMTANLPQETAMERLVRSAASFICVWAAVFPASAVYFREVSLLSPISNMLLVPVCMYIMALGMIAVLLGGHGFVAEVLLGGVDWLCGIILRISEAIAGLEWASEPTGSSVLLFVLGAGIIFTLLCHLLIRSRKKTAGAAVLAFLTLFFASGMEDNIKEKSLRIAVLGEGKNCVIVLAQEKGAVLLDMSGTSGLAAYADAYLTENGLNHVEALCLCRPKGTSLRNYDRYFSLRQPERVYVCGNEEPVELFGKEAENVPELAFTFYGANVRVADAQVTVESDGVTYVCTNDAASCDSAPELMTVYGKCRGTVPPCGILTILDDQNSYSPDEYTYVGENNLEMTIREDGKCQIRRLLER